MRKLWHWLTDWLHDPVQARASAFPCGVMVILITALLVVVLFNAYFNLMHRLHR